MNTAPTTTNINSMRAAALQKSHPLLVGSNSSIGTSSSTSTTTRIPSNYVASMMGGGFHHQLHHPTNSDAMNDSLLQHMATSFITANRRNSIGMRMPELPSQRASSLNASQALDSITQDFFDQEDLYEPVPLTGTAINHINHNNNIAAFQLQHHIHAPTSHHQVDGALARFLTSALDQVMDEVEPVEDMSSIFDSAATITAAGTAANHKRTSSATIFTETSPTKRQRRTASSTSHDSDDDDDKSPRFRPYQEKQWVEQFEELVKFSNDRGHCLVPHTFDENPTLSRWVKRQRYQYKLKQEGKPSTMTDARIQQLEDNGFVWDSHAAAWQERRNELAAYQQEHGDCNVPSSYPKNPQLATWVKCQRRQCKLFWNGKPSNMTLDRFTSLNQLGFTWELRGGNGRAATSMNAPKDNNKSATATAPISFGL